MSYTVQYFRDGEWLNTWAPVMPCTTVSEAERLATVRSENTNRVYRVRNNGRTLSQWKNGKPLAKENA